MPQPRSATRRLALGAWLSLVLAACTSVDLPLPSISKTPPANAVVVNVAANASVARWVEEAADAFAGRQRTAGGRPIYARVQRIEAGDAIAAMGKGLPDLWMPDAPTWAEVAAARGHAAFNGNCATTVRSPLVLAVPKDLAESLGYPARSLGWLDIGSLASDAGAWRYYTGGEFGPSLRLGHAHPGSSGSGAAALLAVVQAARSAVTPVAAADIRTPLVQASIAAFEGGVSIFGKNPADLADAMSDRGTTYLGTAVVYESDVFAMDEKAGVVPVYPFEGTFVATHPACVNGANPNAEVREGAQAFQAYLSTPAAQALATKLGYRAVTSDPKQPPVLSAARGFDLALPKVDFGAPPAANLEAVQSVWKLARKPVNMVMVLDTSGSMAGDKMRSMQRAAADFVGQMGTGDRLTVLGFSNNVTRVYGPAILQGNAERDAARRAINALVANGGTALYDGLGEASEQIKRTTSAARSNVIVLLSDGQDTSSRIHKNNKDLMDLIRRENTTTVTIAYGKDADANAMRAIAREGNGNTYSGGEADIATVYAEIATAFGGSAGIGR